MKHILYLIISVVLFLAPAHAQFYSKQWAAIDSAIEKDLPAQASRLITELQDEAARTDCAPQLIAATLTRLQLAAEFSPDSVEQAWHTFKVLANQEQRTDLHALWQVAWAKSLLRRYDVVHQKETKTLLQQLLAQADVLHHMTTGNYAPLFDEQPSSALYANDLLHVVVREALQCHLFTEQERKAICQDFVVYYRSKGYLAGALLLELRHGDAKTIAQQYAELPEAVEAYIQQVQEVPLSTNEEVAAAIKLAQEGLQRYPSAKRSAWLKQFIEQRQLPNVSLTVGDESKVFYPTHPTTLHLSSVNVKDFELVCRYVDNQGRTISTTRHALHLPEREPWFTTDTTFTLSLPQSGRYICEMWADGDSLYQRELLVSRLRPLLHKVGNNPCRVMALDAVSGAPVTDFALVAYDTDHHILATYRPNAQGEVYIKNHPLRRGQFAIVTEGDSCSPTFRIPTYYAQPEQGGARTVTQLFTDRSIYRPNQWVRFGGLVFTQHGDEVQSKPNYQLSIQAIDTEGTVFAETTVTTDKNGDFIGEFKVPETLRPGGCTLRAESKNTKSTSPFTTHFRVEEYQRASFQVAINPQSEAYAAGDTLTISGQARTYTDIALTDAQVNFRILNRTMFRRGGVINDTISTGRCTVQADGRFAFPFIVPHLTENASPWTRQTYGIEVDVIAAHGEMQTAQSSISVGTQASFLDTNMPSQLKRERMEDFCINLRNASGMLLEAPIAYQILNQSGEVKRSGITHSKTPLSDKEVLQLLDGQYQLVAHAAGADTLKLQFMLWSDHTRRLPIHSPFFFHTEHSEQGDSVKVYVGTSHRDVTLFYDEFDDSGAIVHSKRLNLSDTLMSFNLVYTPERRLGFGATFAFMKYSELYDRCVNVVAPRPDKRLNLQWETFRNHLKPGDDVHWRLKVTTPDNRPTQTSVLTTVYDAALDDIMPHQWYLPLNFARELPFANITTSYAYPFSMRYHKPWAGEPVEELTFTDWHRKWFSYFAPRMITGGGMKLFATVANPNRIGMKESTDQVLREIDLKNVGYAASSNQDATNVRTNFAETAYFGWVDAPQGTADLEFTLPQSLTQWRVMLLAHDSTVNHTLRIDTINVHQDFMVQSALPRFAYEGDVVSVPFTLTNQTDETRCGTLDVVFTDTTTQTVVKHVAVPFEIEAKQSEVHTVQFEVPLGTMQLICKCEARGTHFCDGELRQLEVKSQWVKAERSIPFSMKEAGASFVDLKSLWTNKEHMHHATLSVRITPNAMHEALTSLCKLADHKGTSSSCYAQRFYAASLALWVLQQQGESTDSLFNLMKSARQESLLMLHRLMTPEGEWAWFDGMRPNFSVTTDIALLLARLSVRTNDVESQELLNKTLGALQCEVKKRVAEMRAAEQRSKSQYHPYIGEALMRYLRLYPLLQLTIDDDAQYLINHAAQLNKSLSMHNKAVLSEVLNYAERTAESEVLLQSIREHLVSTPEMGLYFDTYRAEMKRESYRQETQVAAVEAFASVGDTVCVEGMLHWLLQSKRTQQWHTNRITADVVYALLFLSTKHLSTTQNAHAVETTFCDQRVPLSTTRLAHRPQEATHLKVVKANTDLTWGSVTVDYETPISEIEESNSGLAISQHLEVEHEGQWQPLKKNMDLTVGQRVRRTLVIKANRDYDFVEIQAYRAATCQPYAVRSGYDTTTSLPVYRAVRDDVTEYYVEKLPKGKHVLTEILVIDRLGLYNMGITHVKCVHAPEFAGYSKNFKLQVSD